MEIQCFGVVGAGQMGQGIAQVAAQSGYSVCMADQNLAAAQAGIDKIKAQLNKQVEKQKMTAESASKVLNNLKAVGALSEMKNCDLIVEAVSENIELKKKIWKELDQNCKPSTIFASNTSSISIGEIASATQRPAQFAGMHFMNPVPVMKLVEGISAKTTSKETFATIRAVAEKMGKIFVESQDVSGFIVNRVLMPMINEAAYAFHEGVASAKDIDTAMVLGTNQPMGPLTLADFIGLDTCVAILEVLEKGLGDKKYAPCPILKQYVAEGRLGKKAGKGFYNYG